MSTLLLLARYGKQEQLAGKLPKVSQLPPLSMVETTRSSVTAFMNKFGAPNIAGFNCKIKANTSLSTVVFDDQGGKYFLKPRRILDAAEKSDRHSTSNANSLLMDMR